MKHKIGLEKVHCIEQVLEELETNQQVDLKDGFSFLLRVKNEFSTIEKCILDIVDIADEIIVVDNNSSDGTKELIRCLEKKYDHVFFYEYNIEVPRAGQAHIDNCKRKDLLQFNTLKNYYNWTLSKSSCKKVIKWDADFYCIKDNLIELLRFIKPRISENNAVFFSGVTLFIHRDNSYLKKKNHYNEYRIFSKDYGFEWSDTISNNNENICETSWHIVPTFELSKLYIYTKPVFFEIKSTEGDEFASRDTLFEDGRDNVDKKILDDLRADILNGDVYFSKNPLDEHSNFEMNVGSKKTPIYLQDNIINEYRNPYDPSPLYIECVHNHWPIEDRLLLINLTAPGIGGVEEISSSLFAYFNQILETKFITTADVKSSQYISFEDFKNYIHSIQKNISILCTTNIFSSDELNFYKEKYAIKFYGMVHSDVAYYNSYFIANADKFEKIIVINKQTLNKYREKNIDKVVLIYNNIKFTKELPIKAKRTPYKFLFFSRASVDKNLIMLLYAFKKLIKKYEYFELDLYIGNNQYIQKYIDFLGLQPHVFSRDPVSVSNDEKSLLYSQYDVCLLPSVSEGCSLNILESIDAQTPILCSNIEPNREIINGLLPMFEFKNLDDISSKYDFIYDYNEYIDSLGYDIQEKKIESPYLTYNDLKICIFEKNIDIIVDCIECLISNFEHYKNNTIILKKLLKNKYFNLEKYYKDFHQVLL